MRILDLGTGSGYLSFPIAQNNPDITFIGLDIVEKELEVNRAKANIRNIRFESYHGIALPFADGTFDMDIITSETAEVFHNDDIYFSCLGITKQSLFNRV